MTADPDNPIRGTQTFLPAFVLSPFLPCTRSCTNFPSKLRIRAQGAHYRINNLRFFNSLWVFEPECLAPRGRFELLLTLSTRFRRRVFVHPVAPQKRYEEELAFAWNQRHDCSYEEQPEKGIAVSDTAGRTRGLDNHRSDR